MNKTNIGNSKISGMSTCILLVFSFVYFLVPERVYAGSVHHNITESQISLSTRTPVKVKTKSVLRLNQPRPGHIQRWTSTNESKAILVCVHALGLSAHAYEDFGNKFSEAGYDIYAIDVRGFGNNRTVQGRDKLDLNRTVDDIKILISFIRKNNTEKPLFLVGESMGGAVVLKAASKYPELISGILVSAPAYKLYKLKRLTFKGLGDILLPGTGPAAKSVIVQATSNIKLREHWRKDSSNHKLDLSFGEAISYYRFVRNSPKYSNGIKVLPVCILHGLNDHLAKPSGSAKIFKNLRSKDKLLVIDCLAEHILLEEEQLSNRLQNLISAWLEKHIGSKVGQSPSRVIVIDHNKLNSKDREKLELIKSISGEKSKNIGISNSALLL